MKAGRSVDGIVYPDVGQQISDLVSQQSSDTEAPQSKALVRKNRIDEFSPVVSSGYSRLDQLVKRDFPPLSSFGFVTRPAEWQASAAIFHQPETSRHLKNLA